MIRESAEVSAAGRREGGAENDRRLRILNFIDSFERGGSEGQFVLLNNRLDSDSRIDSRLGCLRLEGALLEQLKISTGEVRAYPLDRFYDLNGTRQVLRLARYLRRERIDVVHSWDFYSNIICGAASLIAPHTRFIASRRYLKLSDRRLHRFGELATLQIADRVVFNSRVVAEQVWGEKLDSIPRAAIIPNGLDLARFANGGPPARRDAAVGSFRIGMVARLDPRKDHTTFLRAAARLIPDWPDLEIVLMGDGPARGELESEVRRLGLSNNVLMLGTVTNVPHQLSKLDLGVLTSRFEAMPNAVLEYLAAGLPVVATNVGGIPEIVRHGREGVLVQPGRPRELAEAIEGLLRDAPRRNALSRAARRRAKAFSIDLMAERMTGLYFSVGRQRSAAEDRRVALTDGE